MDEREQLRARLVAAGVDGVEDLGRFVSKPELLGESSFDERAAERRGTVVGEQAARQVKRARTSLSSKVHTVTP